MSSMLRVVLCCLVVSCFAHAGVLVPKLVRIPSPAGASAQFGLSVASIGDVNGDGISDLLVGAPGADKAFVISGADQTVLRTISDPDGLTGNRFGFAVVAAGDWNGDGVPDFAVGAPGDEMFLPLPCPGPDPCPPDPASGRVFVFSGSDGALIRKITPPVEAIDFGYSLANLGDVNGDGKPDLAVGMPVHAHFFGSVFAFSGSNGAVLWQTM